MTDNLKLEKTEAPEVDNPQTDQDVDSQDEGNNNEDVLIKRYKEQINGSKQEAEKFRSMVFEQEVQKASQDATSLLDLHNKDPKLAKEVAERFDFDNFGGYESFLKNGGKAVDTHTKDGFTEEKFEEMYQKRKTQEEHEKALQKAEKKIAKLDETVQERARDYFNKISDGKTLDTETALEFVEMATLYVSKDKLKADKLEDSLTQLGSTGLKNTKPVQKKEGEQDYIVRGGKLILNPNR